jgi:superfamily II DNA or RNA helicase
MTLALRPYQSQAVADLRAAYADGARAPLFVLPTGGGKTFTFTYVAESAAARGNRVLILVHRQELLLQASRSLSTMGLQHGLIAAGFPRTGHAIQVASVQTLVRRLDTLRWTPDLIVVDEAHHAIAGSWRRILNAYPAARVLGVTATPVRSDGKGLADVFDRMVAGPSVAQLIEMGHLVRPVVYAPPTDLSLEGVRRRMGDFDQKQLAERVDKPVITGSAVGHYRKLCDGRPAIAFCVSVAHAQHVAAQFTAAGYVAQSIDGSMADADRKAAIDNLSAGRIHVLTSCDIVSEGTDIPVVAAAILLRPTQSLGLFIQQVGRALRPAPGKDRAIILDHVGNCLRHGMPDDDREWSLDGLPPRERDREAVPPVSQCPQCYSVYRPAAQCPTCGHVVEVKARQVEEQDGELQEVDADQLRRDRAREVGQARTLEALIEVAKRRGYKAQWAHHVWRSRQHRSAA